MASPDVRRFGSRAALAALLLCAGTAGAQETAVERGAYLAQIAGCITCHTDSENDGPALAGGYRIETDFGTFVTPNITPDRETGIGNWSERDFITALKRGLRPDGDAYYPAFPYPSYSGMTYQDAQAIYAYLMSLEPVDRPNEEHDLLPLVGWRVSANVWRDYIYGFADFEIDPLEAAYVPDPAQSEEWNRGAYLVRHLGHCGECHTPRNFLGVPESERYLAGARAPDGEKIPNITPHEDAIGDWSEGDLSFFLQLGLLPDGDAAGGSMGAVISDMTGKLTPEDRQAMTRYLLSLGPLASD